MSTDLERGLTPQAYNQGQTSHLPPNPSHTSLPEGIGPALSSNNTSIIGSDGPAPNPAEEWGPQHPCFPHMNPHVPLASPLYRTTRIIRIRRDWMVAGDLAPTFSNLYPEILDPAGVSEPEFRKLVERVNAAIVPAYDPATWRNVLDGLAGLLTGWLWDDFGLAAVKDRLCDLEVYLEEWNKDIEAKAKGGLGTAPVIVPLRRTGYMNVRSFYRYKTTTAMLMQNSSTSKSPTRKSPTPPPPHRGRTRASRERRNNNNHDPLLSFSFVLPFTHLMPSPKHMRKVRGVEMYAYFTLAWAFFSGGVWLGA